MAALKPSHLRQRRNKAVGRASLVAPEPDCVQVHEIPNPDGRNWHPLTLGWWRRVWASPMASQYVESDLEGLGRLAVIVDDFNLRPCVKTLAEIRQQEARFGLSPLDRTRLQWEIAKTDEAERKRPRAEAKKASDPRFNLVKTG